MTQLVDSHLAVQATRVGGTQDHRPPQRNPAYASKYHGSQRQRNRKSASVHVDAANPPNRVTSPRKSVPTIVPDPDLPVVTFIKGIDRSNSIVVIGRLIEGLFSNAKCECPDFKVELLDLSEVPLFAVHLPSSVCLDLLFRAWAAGVRQGLGWDLSRSPPFAINMHDDAIPVGRTDSIDLEPSCPELSNLHDEGYDTNRNLVQPAANPENLPKISKSRIN